jgi:uncharacterized protein
MTASDRRFKLSLLPECFAIVRLAADTSIPAWAEQGSFFSITRTAEELSIVCPVSNIPRGSLADGAGSQGDWRVLKVHGPFVLSEIGVVSALAAPLAGAKISLFVISTFDTDYLLVNSVQSQAAVAALQGAGHTVLAAISDS